jgi:glycosyltransferase involved in cell wall biosynthesis
LKILFLSSGRDVPSSRFRIQAYAPRFRDHGHRVIVAPSFPEKYDYFTWLGFRLSQWLKRSVRVAHWLRSLLCPVDIVYIEREIFDADDLTFEKRFRKSTARLVLDLDDAVFLRYPRKFETLLPLADLVVCGNAHIERFVAPFNPRTLLLPTCIDLDVYDTTKQHASTACPVIGWMGTTGNLSHFVVVAEALRRLAQHHCFKLRIVAPSLAPLQAIDLSGVSIEHVPWASATEVQTLLSFDIGIMPLAEQTEWDRYKCGAKLLQYFAVGLPGVATPVGVNADLLGEQLTGFAPLNSDQWYRALASLLTQPMLRAEQGRNARQLVEERYSVDGNFPRLQDALQRLLASPPNHSVPPRQGFETRGGNANTKPSPRNAN